MLCVLAGGRAIAHPLGNFTINHLAVVTTAPGSLRIHYVLDIAEIPSFQIMNAGAKWSANGRRAWIGEETARVIQGLSDRRQRQFAYADITRRLGDDAAGSRWSTDAVLDG